ncbi:GNAT family N-acetyltransferase [Aspergillus chevalieri]|uniref:N-acetyltransferase domain-containing protein n=1 Tax=Aspergillus chevalieri TaxID=182096 RepID=A0A7R7ZM99_ASPCH|nr:uncharacterized protein ACHE_31260A [Aspergillus chevalieri]BCR87273.1 hypothetical protein ACHE_31260A [Aspergillus chevalieri]
MPLQIQTATPRDSVQLTTVFLAAFSDPFNLTLFPRTPDVRAWWEDKFAREAVAPGQALLKVVDAPDASSSTGGNEGGEGEGEIAAFAIWKFPNGQSREKQKEVGQEEEEDRWPQSSDPTLCQRFFGGMAAKRGEYMGLKPHYYLDMLGTHPSYNGKGIASMLLKWGLDRADNDKVPVFLSASPAGKPVYERRGFRVVQEEEVAGGYVQAYMVRD